MSVDELALRPTSMSRACRRAARSGVLSLMMAGACCTPAPPNDGPNWQVEKNARPSETHPLGGFWKPEKCDVDFGLAIGPMGERMYYVSFCGPGGCFAEGTYRPATAIYGDPSYSVLDEDTIEVVGLGGQRTKYIRCPGRTPAT